mmetsp:Transcript_63824/g.118626  ORF Transcript_63824/g.118626 Transcript_63824/m.118626 type:complete len:621 (+) Transcript_63824:22-1884(+)
MAQCASCPAGGAPLSSLRGLVKYHGGQERSPGVEDAGLLVSLRVLLHGAEHDEIEVEFSQVWAMVLTCLEPDDELTVTGAQEIRAALPGDSLWRLPAVCPPEVEVKIVRQFAGARLETTLNQEALEDVATSVPKWLRPPGSRPTPQGYQYVRYMCTLRPGAEANLYMLVWENARPGPQEFGDKTSMNITVVDPSFKALPPSDWTTDCALPQFSLQLQLWHGGSSRPTAPLPFLCVGDVVRIHRAKVANKPPRFINIRQQSYSSVVAFAFAGDGTMRQIAVAKTPSHIGEEDEERIRQLHAFARNRLSTASMCNSYLKTLSEAGRLQWQEDVIVCVFEIIPRKHLLLVSDGSIHGLEEVFAEDPPLAAEWLFANVKVGHWVKLRAIMKRYNDSGIRVSAAMVTRVPTWCFDVKQRILALDRMAVDPPAPQDEPAGEPAVRSSGVGAQRQQAAGTFRHHVPQRDPAPRAARAAQATDQDRPENQAIAPPQDQPQLQRASPERSPDDRSRQTKRAATATTPLEAREPMAPEAAQQEPQGAGAEGAFEVGMRIEIVSRSNAEINGKLARLERFDGTRGKWVCRLECDQRLFDVKQKSMRPRPEVAEMRPEGAERETSRSPRRVT